MTTSEPGTGRIRWEGTPMAAFGYVGTAEAPVFRIWPPEDGETEWLLTADLPGRHGDHRYAAGSGEAKAEAERWLAEFVSSLGAIFPEPTRPAARPGRRQLGDADILDAFRTVTNWSDAEVLHYESCDQCNPEVGLVCDAIAAELAAANREAST